MGGAQSEVTPPENREGVIGLVKSMVSTLKPYWTTGTEATIIGKDLYYQGNTRKQTRTHTKACFGDQQNAT